MAIDSRHFHSAKLLVERGADIFATDNQGRTPFSVARDDGHFDIFFVMLRHYPDSVRPEVLGHFASDDIP